MKSDLPLDLQFSSCHPSIQDVNCMFRLFELPIGYDFDYDEYHSCTFSVMLQANEGDGAFYRPKIDTNVSDALNMKFQCATLQLHFLLPACFELYYSAEGEEGKKEAPVMIHIAIFGSVEHMFAILLEHYRGKCSLAITVANPTDLVKFRLQAERKLPPGAPRRYSGTLNASSSILRQEGVGVL
ncbi:threonine--tRNA ligase-like [Rosa chinensis]|uniref:threonine--tRNA ligase-like n=1 Tax=Rosa chinensis TaxID=74649 RepID=UPI001AD91D59|nr:threonine--tRNA ligase-like [Rosa chinensis]